MSDKINKGRVISFRVSDKSAEDCDGFLKGAPVWGVKSVNQFARKLFLDYQQGRLTYDNPDHEKMDSELIAEESRAF